MAFTGSLLTDYIRLTNNSAFDLPDGNWTVAGWVKCASTSVSTSDSRICSRNTSGSDGVFGLAISSGGIGTNYDELTLELIDNDGTSMDLTGASNSFTSNTSWTHVIAQRVTNTVTIYVNNSSVATATDSTLDAIGSDNTGEFTGDLVFFNREGTPTTKGFGGSLAEWAKWNRALNASELVALSSGYSPLFFTASLSWYAPMVRDYVERKLNLSVTNSGTSVSDHPRIIYPSSGFNTRGIAAAEQTVTLSGLASTSAYGTQSVLLNITGAGISSTSAFGTQSILLNLNTTGIASTSGFGTQSILLNIDASGIASISAIGTQILANTQILTLSGIASSSAFGTQSILMNLDLTGIPSTSVFGTSGLELSLTLSGISSTSALGTSGLELNLSPSGISSTSAFGTGVLSYVQGITLSGIPSTTLFGLVELGNVQVILFDGLPSISAFGTSALFDRSFVIVTPTAGAFTQVDD